MAARSKIRSPLAAFIVFMTCSIPLIAQQYRFRNYGTEDGLTNLAVKVLFQDRTGFLWAATENGIFRFDGVRFQRYGTAEGLPREVVVSLGEAPDGSVLAGCAAGLYRQNGDRFEKVPLPGGGSVGTYSGIQSDGHGRTYIGTERGLVMATAGANGNQDIVLLPPAPANAGGTDVHGLLLEKDALWYGCGMRLCRLRDGAIRVFDEPDGVPAGKWTCIRRDGEGDLWASEKRRTIVLRRGKARFEALATPAFPPTAGGGQFEVDRGGRLLVPTIQGLAIKDGPHLRIVGRNENLRAPVYSVFQDREGSIWAGLGGRGLARWQGYAEWDGFSPTSGLDSELIYEILPRRDGTVWVGTENGLFLGRDLGSRWTWRLHQGVGKVPVHAVKADEDGSVWLGTEGYGAARVDSRTDRVEWFRKERGLAGEPYSLAVDSQRVWAATDRGLYVANLSERRFRRVEELPAIRCWKVTEAPGQEILVGTVEGLFRLSRGRWRHISKADGLIDNVVLATASAKNGEIWVGYWFSGALTRIRVDGEHLSMTHYGHDQGMKGELTYFLNFDGQGRLWAGTDEGVQVRSGERWTHYDQNDGLIWNDCDLNGFAAGPDGTVWIGTSGGLSRFRPRPNKRQELPPAVVFTRLMLGGAPIQKQDNTSVGHRSNSLVVQYAALAFARESDLLFRYRLQPLSSDWRETPLRELQFPGLPPDRYHLEVQARDERGNWTAEPAVFAFTIQAPWWRTWWFPACAASILLLLVRAAWRWRVSQLVQRQQELERIVADRTRELQHEKRDLLLARDALRERAMKDGLTQLLNRSAFFEALDREWAGLQREPGSLALILADLDLFKQVNDTHGHIAGDMVLKEAARRFVSSVRSSDIVGRYGGEELVILLIGCELGEAAVRAEEVRQRIVNELFTIPGDLIKVTCSFGVAATNGPGCGPEALLQAADQALYQAKTKGRNCVAVYRPEEAHIAMPSGAGTAALFQASLKVRSGVQPVS